MSLEERIMQDMKEAMKAKDKAALRGLRAIKSAILLFKTSGSGKPLDEEEEIKLLQKLVKQRQESHDIYAREDRDDLAQTEQEEIEVIQRYLPEQLSDEELTVRLKAIVEDLGAESMREMGKVMQVAQEELAGKADGKTIANIVKQLLGA